MIFISKKAFEEAVQHRVYQENEQRDLYRRLNDMQCQLDKMSCDLHDLRMKADPEFRAQHTPPARHCNCGSDMAIPISHE